MARLLHVSFEHDDFVPVDLVGSEFAAAVSPVVTRAQHGFSALGTAFCIAAGLRNHKALYVTARHVVNELLPTEAPIEQWMLVPIAKEPYVLLPSVIRPGLDRSDPLICARIEQFSVCGAHSDIAVLRVDHAEVDPPPNGAPSFPLSVAEPKLGETCCALGYPEMPRGPAGEHQEIIEDEAGGLAWNVHPRASQTTIEEILPAGLGETQRAFPSFRTGAYFPSGMSGGPIIRQDGRVIGVVAHGYGRETRLSFGAVMAAIIRASVRLYDSTGTLQVVDFPTLARQKLVDVDDSRVTWTGTSLNWHSQIEVGRNEPCPCGSGKKFKRCCGS
jgi:hypothetical protein